MTQPVSVPRNEFWLQLYSLCQTPRINFDFNDTTYASPEDFDFNDTTCTSPPKSILISMTQPVSVPKNEFWLQLHSPCQAPRINFDFNDTAFASPQDFDFNDTTCASPLESVLISMTQPVPVPKNQFWFQWHNLCQSPRINFDFNDSLFQSPRINFDFNDTTCASPQESILISMTQPVPVPKNQFWFQWQPVPVPKNHFRFQWHNLCQSQESILISMTACASPQETFSIHWHNLCQSPRISCDFNDTVFASFWV